MDHINILRVRFAGETSDGRHFTVSDYIEPERVIYTTPREAKGRKDAYVKPLSDRAGERWLSETSFPNTGWRSKAGLRNNRNL